MIALLAILLLVPAGDVGRAEQGDWSDCLGPDFERRVTGCSRLIEGTDLTAEERGHAYANRALAHAVRGQHALALSDYDAALAITPDFPVALNNRAWTLFRAGRPEAGRGDVERALALDPLNPHALDTRAHIRQALGDAAGAMADYRLAMRMGGERLVMLYQCGLQAARVYEGEIDGVVSVELVRALEVCIETAGCDPLPADEECRKATS
jgi:tetratricopeptide (TPR) repeat protein